MLGASPHQTARPTSPTAAQTLAAVRTPRTVQAYVTFYGWYDNTPPGCATAYSGCAGGTGTYNDPITLASARAELPVGTIVYYPIVQKYFVMGDSCQECGLDWRGHGPNGGPHLYHVDLWLGGENGNAFDVINCESALTQGTLSGGPGLTSLVINPPAGLPVSGEQLFNSRTNHCFGGMHSAASTATYRNAATGNCLTAPAATPPTGPATTSPCTAATTQRIGFDGAFLTSGSDCLQINGPGAGSPLGFAPCTGGPNQQWEVNPTGTITWVQYTLCAQDDGGTLSLRKCTGAANQSWTSAPLPSGAVN